MSGESADEDWQAKLAGFFELSLKEYAFKSAWDISLIAIGLALGIHLQGHAVIAGLCPWSPMLQAYPPPCEAAVLHTKRTATMVAMVAAPLFVVGVWGGQRSGGDGDGAD